MVPLLINNVLFYQNSCLSMHIKGNLFSSARLKKHLLGKCL